VNYRRDNRACSDHTSPLDRRRSSNWPKKCLANIQNSLSSTARLPSQHSCLLFSGKDEKHFVTYANRFLSLLELAKRELCLLYIIIRTVQRSPQ
jgi:hypothetical protein